MEKESIILESANTLINSSKLTEKKRINNGISVSEIDLDKKVAYKLGKNKGKYITVYFDKLNGLVEILIKEIEKAIKDSMKYLNVKKTDKILIVGLGNKNITSDSLGYLVIEKMDIEKNTYKIYKDVEHLTNINSTFFIKNLSKTLDVNLVIIIDSLAAKNLERLNKTIQISTGGIKPGSAFSKKMDEISEITLKVPVIAIGVPTIINIKDLLKEDLKEDLIVTEKNIDLEIDNIASMISIALNRIF